ncbi:MAG: methyltransferase domain-containing protein, partial [Chloroflexota bacterium]
ELKPWLANFCHHTVNQVSPYIRPWHLYASVWYGTCFDGDAAQQYLTPFCTSDKKLTVEANTTLMSLSQQLNNTTQVIQWIAACPDQAIKTILSEFGHPDLAVIPANTFNGEPDYTPLNDRISRAKSDAAHFAQFQSLCQEIGLTKDDAMLDLACGPLATQAHLFHSAGYQMCGADIDIPPAYIPRSGIKQRLKRGKFVKAWQNATKNYYDELARETGLMLQWRKLKIHLADLRRLPFPDHHFKAILCSQFLQHAPDVEGVLGEIQRVLAPGGIVIVDIIPYTSFQGGFLSNPASPWQHLRILPSSEAMKKHSIYPLNKWLEPQYQTAIEAYFTIEHWQTEQDEAAKSQLTSDIAQELEHYSEEALTRSRVIVVARKS